MSDELTLSPFYHSAVNEVTKPNSLVFVSHYFADRWMRDLGPVGSAIVIALRPHCYQNRSAGELRNRIQLPVPQIAAEVGVSPKTVRREMDANKTLQRFVQRREEYAPGPTPQSLRTDSYSYLVAMDDPVHPLDQERLQEAVREKVRRMEKGGGEGDAKDRARRRQGGGQKQVPPGQSDQAAPSRVVNLSIPLGQSVPEAAKLSIPPGQIDQALKESSESSEFKENPSSDFSLSLFGGEDKPKPPGWPELTEAQRAPWLDRARQELFAIHAGSGVTPKERLVESRARNLYDLSLRKIEGEK